MAKTLTAAQKAAKATRDAETRKKRLAAEAEAAALLEQEEGSEEGAEETKEEGASADQEVAKAESFDPAKKTAAVKKEEKVAKVKLSEVEQHKADLERFKREIEVGPKTMFMVPLDQGEKAGATKVVSLNGVSFTIKKGAMVTIPVVIAEVLAEQYEVEMNAGKEMLLDRNEQVTSALE